MIEAENAQRCVNDPACLVYMGTYNSGAAKLSMPITNAAGIAQVSPPTAMPASPVPANRALKANLKSTVPPAS
ncbi:MAG: hypothetical protein IPK52_16385 [Chloroflexi bacterium]|nr:hypothetical protein [Chloroflexota bacterium]